jgi:hypothetical protein
MSRAIPILAVAFVAGALACGGDSKPSPVAAQASSAAAVSSASFEGYDVIEYGIVRFGASADHDEESRWKVDAALRACMAKVPNARPARSAKDSRKTLLLEPTIEQIRRVSSTARFWGGPFAGSSSITMRVTFKDKGNGRVVGVQAFGESANALAAAWSFGARDLSMLEEVSEQVCAYMLANAR